MVHQTHDLEIDLSINVQQKDPFFQVVNYILTNSTNFVKYHFKMKLEFIFINTYKSIMTIFVILRQNDHFETFALSFHQLF